jgi:hypothetical protein
MRKSSWMLALGCAIRVCLATSALHVVVVPSFEEHASPDGDTGFLVRASGYAAVFDHEGATFYDVTRGSDSASLHMRIQGGAARPEIAGEGRPLASTVIYNAASGVAGAHVRNHAAVRYRDVYPGIDWVWEFRGDALEARFELAPGADARTFALQFEGASALRVDDEGNLEIEGGVGLFYRRPVAWQDGPGGRIEIPVSFRAAASVVQFQLGSHDRDLPLTIDPVIRYSRYLGGAGYDAAYAMALDSAGNIYVTGETSSVDFASSRGIRAGRDAFVSKLSADGVAVYTVILSSTGNDAGRAIAIDRTGNVWIAGVAGGPGFPTTAGPLGPAFAEDVFVAKLNTAGALAYSTRLGGSGTDVATAIGLDGAENVYIAGYTSSADFPTTSGAPQTAYRGGTDAFAAKLPTGGGALSYSTLLGGSGHDPANALNVDTAGNACIAGRTDSSNLPVINPLQRIYGGSGDAFLACLNPTGTAWTALTYFGGIAPDQANALVRDGAGNLYMAGETFSLQGSSSGTYDAFVIKLTPAGSALVYSSLLVGSGSDSAAALAVDSTGVWVAGLTSSTDFPVTGAPGFGGSYDAFLANLSVDGRSLALANFIGGAGDDRCMALALTATGEAVVVGVTNSANLAVTSGTAPAPYNAFVTSWKMDKAVMTSPTPGSQLSGTTVTFAWRAGIGATAYWLDINGACVSCGGGLFGRNVGLATSQTVSGLPASGGAIYVRLWTLLAGGWQYIDYSYTAASGGTRAAMTTPAAGTTLTGSTVTFTWSAGSGALAYWLDVGTAPGVGNYFGKNLALATSQTVTNLPTNGSAIRVRLWTQFSGGWQYNDYSYTASH